MSYSSFEITLKKHIKLFEKNRAKTKVHLILNRKSSIIESITSEQVKLFSRGLSDEKSADLILRFENTGVELCIYEGDMDFVRHVVSSDFKKTKKYELVYQAGVSSGGPAHRSLIPVFCYHFGLQAMNSNAASRTVIWHKLFHSKLLESSNILTPKTFLFEEKSGWYMGEKPPIGMKVILKSTYESYAVGVDENSIFLYNKDYDWFIKKRSIEIGQPVILQEFIEGDEVYVPIIELDKAWVLPAQLLYKHGTPVSGDDILSFSDNVNRASSFDLYKYRNTDLKNEIQSIALNAFDVAQQSGVSRVDVRIDRDSRIYIIDQAEVPSLTRKHAYNKAFVSMGGKEEELIPAIIASNLKSQLCLQ